MKRMTKPKKKMNAGQNTSRAKAKPDFYPLRDFINSLQSLDPAHYGSWSSSIKVIVCLGIISIIVALAYGFFISNTLEKIAIAENEEKTLLTQYKVKEAKARSLNAYQNQMTAMTLDFKELLNQLPKEPKISDLVQGINTIGVDSHIRFQDILIEPEVTKDYFIEQPIRIVAVGDYHQFGNFMSGLAKMPRIVTLHDFEINNTKPTLDQLPELTLVLAAKSYRTKDMSPDDLKKLASAPASTSLASASKKTSQEANQ